jgi:hypothetical protein
MDEGTTGGNAAGTGSTPERGTARPIDERGQVYSWKWGRDEDRRPQLPWFGIFLVILGALLIVDRTLPEYRSLGNLVVLAAGLAFLVAWLIRRGTFALYAGALLTAAGVPGVLNAIGYPPGPGVGTFAYGIALLFIAGVRATTGGGWGWQLLLGTILLVLGASVMTLPGAADLVAPALLVILGVVLLVRGGRR